jgi:hypothetical protein
MRVIGPCLPSEAWRTLISSCIEVNEMFKHILVAIDGSTYSQQALPTAIEVARKFNSDVLVEQ